MGEGARGAGAGGADAGAGGDAVVVTRVGWADYGDFEHFGRRLYRSFDGTGFLALVVYGVTGTMLGPEEAATLDEIALCMHVPEPRVWPLKLARVAASHGDFATGLVAGCAVAGSHAIGARTVEDAANLLVELAVACDAADGAAAAGAARDGGGSVEAVAREGGARGAGGDDVLVALLRSGRDLRSLGFQGRPVDERVVAMRARLERRGRTSLRYWRLVTRLWEAAAKEKRGGANAFGASAAALLDLGLSPAVAGAVVAVMFQSSFVAHAFEGEMLQSRALVRLPREAMRYVGPPARVSPRAAALRQAALAGARASTDDEDPPPPK